MSKVKRVKHYMATVYCVPTGSSSTRKQPFTQIQAREVNGVLESDGLSVVLASKLCALWTRRGQYADVRYSYTLCPEELL